MLTQPLLFLGLMVMLVATVQIWLPAFMAIGVIVIICIAGKVVWDMGKLFTTRFITNKKPKTKGK